MEDPDRRPAPAVVAVEMGYGHLRAAWPLAEALGAPVLHVDRSPLADETERRLWARVRGAYETVSRLSQAPVLGRPLGAALDALTRIPPLFPSRDLSAPTREVRALEALVGRGMGRGLVEHLRRTGAPLLTTFYSCAVIADLAGLERLFCVVTDTDVNRVWAPPDPARTRIRYLAPCRRVVDRLRAYGVPAARISLTGFPLPGRLLGGPELPALKRNLAARLVRLDPAGAFRASLGAEASRALGLPLDGPGGPPLLVYAVGGAGAQVDLVARFLPGLRPLIESGRLSLALVAGVRPEVVLRLRAALRAAGLEPAVGQGVEVLFAPDMGDYFAAFEELLARADLLWTKPSELSFYAALGLPLVCAPPMGVHERYNRRWLVESGAGLEQREPEVAGEWLGEWLRAGTLAAAAFAGFARLPNRRLYEILAEVGAAGAA